MAATHSTQSDLQVLRMLRGCAYEIKQNYSTCSWYKGVSAMVYQGKPAIKLFINCVGEVPVEALQDIRTLCHTFALYVQSSSGISTIERMSV